MFAIVPIVDGTLDIDYLNMIEGKTISSTQAVVMLRDGVTRRDTWQEITEAEYLAYFGGGYASVDKPEIAADGVDTATVTVQTSLAEVEFYSDGNYIATIPVVGGVATLQITSETPNRICITAGQDTQLRLNTVEVVAR